MTLRPWIGYEDVEPKKIIVSSIDDLRNEARNFIGVGMNDDIRLYYYYYNEATNKRSKVQVSSKDNIVAARDKGDGVIWVCKGDKSPTSSPTKKNSQFEDIELYEDKGFECLCNLLNVDNNEDMKVGIIFAIPGSGKSRTVKEAASAKGYQHCRVMFKDLQITKLRNYCKEHKAQRYEEWKLIIQKKVAELMKVLIEGTKIDPNKRYVLHLDEAQTLMSKNIVNQANWNVSTDPWDLVMPFVCSWLDSMASTLCRVVISGTNFFGPLVFNSGSQMKTEKIPIDGLFPSKFVIDIIQKRFFLLSKLLPDVEQTMIKDVEFLRANRRAVEHYLKEIQQDWSKLQKIEKVTVENATCWSRNAFDDWSGPVIRCLGNARKEAVSTLALLLYPDSSRGDLKDDTFYFPLDYFPEDVMNFALGGGLNISITEKTVTCKQPFGCVWKLLTELCYKALVEKKVEELKAFVEVVNTEPLIKGHVLERAIACELTMLQAEHRIYNAFVKAVEKIGPYQPDVLCFAQPFVYLSTIAQTTWKAHTVYCCWGEEKTIGLRFVDLGFPLLCRNSELNNIPSILQVMCQIKSGYVNKCSSLWKMCLEFFEKMKEFVEKDKSVIACFLTETKFLHFEPRDKVTKKKGELNAFSSRAGVLQMMKNNQFIVVEDICSLSVFPLKDIIKKEPNVGVNVITDQLDSIYVSTPQKKLDRNNNNVSN